MNAEIVAVGTELLLGQTTNSNARYLSEQLAMAGVNVFHHQVVGDNMQRLTESILLAQSRSDVVVLCGGLGPTEDDLTRDAVASVLGRSLELDEGVLKHLEDLFAKLGREMTPNNRQQAMRIQGATLLQNPRGTAPGQFVEADGRFYVLLPGPPTEMKPMFEEQVLPLLQKVRPEQHTIRNRILRIFGLGEPAVESKVADLLESQNPTLATYASEGECKVRLTSKAESTQVADEMIRRLEEQVRERLGSWVYGVDGETLPVVVAKLMRERGETLAVFEGATGGVLVSLLQEAPEAAEFIVEAMVLRDGVAGLTKLHLQPYESFEERAIALAEAMRKQAHTDWAIVVSDFTRPSENPEHANLRDAYMAVSSSRGNVVKCVRVRGDAQQLRIRAAKQAAHLLIQSLSR